MSFLPSWSTRPFAPLGDVLLALCLRAFVSDVPGYFDRPTRQIRYTGPEMRDERTLGREEAFASALPTFPVLLYGLVLLEVASVAPVWLSVLLLGVFAAMGLGAIDVIGDVEAVNVEVAGP